MSVGIYKRMPCARINNVVPGVIVFICARARDVYTTATRTGVLLLFGRRCGGRGVPRRSLARPPGVVEKARPARTNGARAPGAPPLGARSVVPLSSSAPALE